jgi:hypothetical protein
MGAGVRKSIVKTKGSSSKQSPRQQVVERIETIADLLKTVSDTSKVCEAIRKRLTTITDQRETLASIFQKLDATVLVTLQSEMIKASNSDQKIVVLTRALFESELDGIDSFVEKLGEMKDALVDVTDWLAYKAVGSSGGEKRNIKELMNMLEKALFKKLGKGPDSSEMDGLVEKLKKLGT